MLFVYFFYLYVQMHLFDVFLTLLGQSNYFWLCLDVVEFCSIFKNEDIQKFCMLMSSLLKMELTCYHETLRTNYPLTLEFTSHTKAIAFADDLAILTYGQTTSEAEAYTNSDLAKVENCAKQKQNAIQRTQN